MTRTVRLLMTSAVLAMAAGIFAGGCATSAMKGTPFYTGEYKDRKGIPEDRVNMWPLVYYSDPALSVLWPFIEKTDEHFAVRPLMSVYGLDQDARVYNFLWPLGEIDQRTGRNRFFPVFWSKDHLSVFPLYWHDGGSGTKVDSLFPAWIVLRNGERRSYHVLWPVFNYKNWGRQTGWRVWPLAGSYESYGRTYSFFAWPLGHSWKDGDDAGSALFPLYWYGRNGESKNFFSLPYSFGRGPEKDWDLGIPLFYREKTATSSQFISPLFFAGSDTGADKDWQCLLPLYYKSREKDREILATLAGGWSKSKDSTAWAVVPALSWGTKAEDKGSFVVGGILGHRAWDKDNGSSHVLPFYYRRKQDDRNVFVSIPYSSGRTKDSSWVLIPPFYYGAKDKTRETMITPLYGRGKALTEDAYWSALMPFYYRDGDKDSSRTVTLAAAWKRDGDDKSWLIYPLLSGGTSDGDSGELWLGGPLFHRQWDKDSSRHHLFPLYYRDSKEHVFASLPYASWKGADGRTARIIPPLLSGMISNEKNKDLWGLGGLVHASWGEGDTPHHVFPLYYRDAGEGRFFSLPYCSKKKGDNVSRVVPPLLSGFTRKGRERRLTLLLGFSTHEWDDASSTGYTVPLYAYGKDYFYTPLVGWNKSKPSGFVYPLTPLLGIRTGEDKGGWLFPLFSYKKEPDNDVSGTYLWGHFWKTEHNSGSGMFPLYSYKNHGSIDQLDVRKDMHQRVGKEFWSLPFCWYRNTVRTWPIYEKGQKTDSVNRMEDKSNGFFPVWSYSSRKNLESGRIDSDGALLFWLFDSKYEKYPERDHEYIRKRVLWRLYHYEKLDGDVSVDVFPFITYDRRKDGNKHFSFMWRLFSYQKKKDGLKVHVLFIPFGKGK